MDRVANQGGKNRVIRRAQWSLLSCGCYASNISSTKFQEKQPEFLADNFLRNFLAPWCPCAVTCIISGGGHFVCFVCIHYFYHRSKSRVSFAKLMGLRLTVTQLKLARSPTRLITASSCWNNLRIKVKKSKHQHDGPCQ